MKTELNSVNEYINLYPKEVQLLLEKVHNTILKKAPEATKNISYGIPAYKTHNKPLVYFASYKKHIGFYATPTSHLVAFRVKEDEQKAKK